MSGAGTPEGWGFAVRWIMLGVSVLGLVYTGSAMFSRVETRVDNLEVRIAEHRQSDLEQSRTLNGTLAQIAADITTIKVDIGQIKGRQGLGGMPK